MFEIDPVKKLSITIAPTAKELISNIFYSYVFLFLWFGGGIFLYWEFYDFLYSSKLELSAFLDKLCFCVYSNFC